MAPLAAEAVEQMTGLASSQSRTVKLTCRDGAVGELRSQSSAPGALELIDNGISAPLGRK